MDSGQDEPCSHGPGSPIRKSPDHSLLAAPRGLSQLATSFIAYLRQGIHTHALSSLTIRFAPRTEQIPPKSATPGLASRLSRLRGGALETCGCPSIFSCQRSLPENLRSQLPHSSLRTLTAEFFRRMVGLGGLEPPTSPLSGVRSNHLSYRPAGGRIRLVELIGLEPTTS